MSDRGGEADRYRSAARFRTGADVRAGLDEVDQAVRVTGGIEAVISYRDVMPRLVQATTLYRTSAEASTVDHYDSEYQHAGCLARYLIRRLAEGATAEFPGLFAAIEDVLNHGDDDAREVIESFLDSLTNQNVFADFSVVPTDFLEWMGPLALRVGWVRQLYE